jgi:hypothetical protein
MDALSAFGFFAVTAMLITYALEPRHFSFCRRLRQGFSLWISTGCMALQRGGGDLGVGRRAALVKGLVRLPIFGS